MAKRSIEIIISAENRTAGALAGAKAELAGYAADVKRINANIAAATRAGDIGAAAGQMGLLGGAQERQATMRQQVEGRAALAARLTAYKEEHAAIRASVGATDELADSHQKVSAEIARGNAGMDQSVDRAVKFGKAMLVVRTAIKGIELATAVVSGDTDKIVAAWGRFPIIGEGSMAGFDLGKALGSMLYGNSVVVSGENPEVEAEFARSKAIVAEANKRGFEAGLTPEQSRMYKRGDQLYEVSKFGPSERGRVAREALLRQFSREDAAEARAKRQAEDAKNAEARAEREADNERYRRESFEGLQDEASTAAEKAAEPRAASGIARRGGYSSVSAFDRGFLTRAPGSTFDESRAKHEENTAKATAATAKATEKTAKAVETLSLRQELLFRELLTALRPGKVINF